MVAFDPRYKLAVDISDHQGIFTTEIETWKQQGVVAAIVRANSASYCRWAVETLRAHDLEVLALYTFGYKRLMEKWVLAGVDLAKTLRVPAYALDIEPADGPSRPIDGVWVDEGSLPELREIASCDRIVERNGLEPIFYTNWSTWSRLGYPDQWRHRKLWLAQWYIGLFPVEEVWWWGKVWVHQVTSTPPLPFRHNLDVNYIIQGDDMTEEQARKLIIKVLQEQDLITEGDENFPTWKRGYDAFAKRFAAAAKAFDLEKVPGE